MTIAALLSGLKTTIVDENTSLCSACLRPLSDEAFICHACGAMVERLDADAFSATLISALKHPSAELRARAIVALGRRRDAAATASLLDLAMRHRADAIEGLMVVGSLTMIGEEASPALGVLAERHFTSVVREAAGRARKKLLNPGAPHA